MILGEEGMEHLLVQQRVFQVITMILESRQWFRCRAGEGREDYDIGMEEE